MNTIHKANSLHQNSKIYHKINRDVESRKKNIGDTKKISNSAQCVSYLGNHALPHKGIRFLDKIIFPSSIRHSISGLKPNLVALYGFSSSQNRTAHFIKNIHENNKVISIADLNYGIGLFSTIYHNPGNVIKYDLFSKLNDLSVDVMSRSVDINFKELKGRRYAELLTRWIDFLNKNIKKTDIFSYVNGKFENEHQKMKTIDKLIIKNTSSNIDVTLFKRFIYENNIFSCGCISEAILLLKAIDKSGGLSANNLLGTFELIQKHFFRNSSKLGIDFFRQNDISIISSWNRPTPDYNEKVSTFDVHEKPYMNSNRRQLDGKETDEPITYSEIRHMVRKHHADINGITRIYLNDSNVEFAPGINKGEWIKKEKSDLLGMHKSKSQA